MRLLVFALCFAAFSSDAIAEEWQISHGTYVWRTNQFCATLTVGSSFGYVYDQGCDGKSDYRAQNVYQRANKIYVDEGVITISRITDAGIIAKWKLQSRESNAIFMKK